MTTWIKNAEIGKNKEIKNAETCQNAQKKNAEMNKIAVRWSNKDYSAAILFIS